MFVRSDLLNMFILDSASDLLPFLVSFFVILKSNE